MLSLNTFITKFTAFEIMPVKIWKVLSDCQKQFTSQISVEKLLFSRLGTKTERHKKTGLGLQSRDVPRWIWCVLFRNLPRGLRVMLISLHPVVGQLWSLPQWWWLPVGHLPICVSITSRAFVLIYREVLLLCLSAVADVPGLVSVWRVPAFPAWFSCHCSDAHLYEMPGQFLQQPL